MITRILLDMSDLLVCDPVVLIAVSYRRRIGPGRGVAFRKNGQRSALSRFEMYDFPTVVGMSR